MRSNFKIIILLFLITLTINSYAAPDTLWTKTMGGSGDEGAYSGALGYVRVAVNENEDIFVLSNTNSSDKAVGKNYGELDAWIVKLNKNGDTIWTKVLGGDLWEIPTSILALEDGGCMIAGYSYSDSADFINHNGNQDNCDGFIARLDSSGNKLWSKQYGGTLMISGGRVIASGNDKIFSLIKSNDGNFIAVGECNSFDGDLYNDYKSFNTGWLLKVDGDGNVIKINGNNSLKIFSSAHSEFNSNTVTDIVKLSDGSGYVLVGETDYFFSTWQILIMKLDNSFNKVWEKEYGGPFINISNSIIEADYGNLIFISYAYGKGKDITAEAHGMTEIWAAKLNPLGELIDQICFGGSYTEAPNDLYNDNKGNHCLVGTTTSYDGYASGPKSNSTDFWSLSFNSNLDTLWSYKSGCTGMEVLTGIFPSPDGKYIYLSGKTESDSCYVRNNYGGSDIWLGKINNPVPQYIYSYCGDSVNLTASNYYTGTDTLTYNWSPTSSLNDANIESPTASPELTTTYYVTITNGSDFTHYDSSIVNIKPIIIDSINIDAGYDNIVYCDDSAQLYAYTNNKGSNTLSYHWTPKNSIVDSSVYNPIIFVDNQKYFKVTVKNNNRCETTDSILVQKNLPVEICVISSSTLLDGDKNLIVWENTNSNSIDSINIYRKTNSSSNYEKIATVESNAITGYTDKTSNPDSIEYKYKISASTCNIETSLSKEHKTMILNSSESEDSLWNLNWTDYEGFDYKNVEIHRGTNKNNLSLIKNTYNSVNTFKDIDPSDNKLYYQIILKNPYGGCNPYPISGGSFNAKTNISIVNYDTNNIYGFNDNSISELPKTKDIYSNDFNDSTLNDLTLINYDELPTYESLLPFNDGWFHYQDWADTTNYYMISNSSYIKPGGADDWLITPAINLKDNSILSWKSRSMDSEYRDSYEVRISTKSNSTKDFTNLLYSIDEESDDWTNRVVNLSNNGFKNQIIYVAFRNVSENKFVLCLDNIKVFEPDSILDIAILSANIPKYSVINNSIKFSGKLVNYSTNDVNSMDLNYQINSDSPVTTNITNVNISSFSDYNYTHDISWTPSTSGKYIIKIWASNINGNEDGNHSNDTLNVIASIIDIIPEKHVLIEEATGAWCGYCPDGAIILDKILEENKNTIGVSMHSGDPMEISDATDFMSNYVSGFPSAIIDRYLFENKNSVSADRNEWEDLAISRLKHQTPVIISGSRSYNDTTREVVITVNAEFIDTLTGDFRVNSYIIEDSVSSTSVSYDQTNFFNEDPNHELFSQGATISGYQHRHVLRSMLGGVWGTKHSIPQKVVQGTKYSYEYTYTIPGKFNKDRISIVYIVQKFDSLDINNREILNVSEDHLYREKPIDTTSISEYSNDYEFINIYPNPFNNETTIAFKNNSEQNIRISLKNAIGEEIQVLADSKFSIGRYELKLSNNDLVPGIYIVNIQTKNSFINKKIILTK